MTPEGSITGATPDVSGSVASDGVSTPAVSSPASATTDSSLAGVQPQSVQGTEQTQTQDDPFAGIASVEELTRLAEQNVPHAKGELQLRTALEALRPQFTDLQSKWQPIEPFAPLLSRFEKPEELQGLLNTREQIYGWEDGPGGQPVPATQSFVKDLAQKAPDRLRYLVADGLNEVMRDPDTGRDVSLMDYTLECIAEDPQRRASALSILGGVEPSQLAPSWQPSQEELDNLCADPANPTPEESAYQLEYRKLPVERREQLRANDPDFIKEHLDDQKFKRETRERDARTQAENTRKQQAYQQYVKQQAENAGNQLVESQLREALSGFATNIREKYQPIAALDPESPEVRAMTPEQVAATTQQIQQTNLMAQSLVILATAALHHPDTRFVADELMKAVPLFDAQALKEMDENRIQWASSARNFGNLNYRRSQGQNGNGEAVPDDMGMLQAGATRGMRNMIIHANNTARAIIKVLDNFFSLKATSLNTTLNGAAQARVVVPGTAFDPTQAAQQRPRATTEAEIMRRARESANEIARR